MVHQYSHTEKEANCLVLFTSHGCEKSSNSATGFCFLWKRQHWILMEFLSFIYTCKSRGNSPTVSKITIKPALGS